NSPVDDSNLAMVAEVDAGLPPRHKAEREHFLDRDSQRRQLRAQCPQTGARADRIGENPATNTAPGRPAKSLDDWSGRVVILKDVKQQVHVVCRLVNIRGQTIDRPLIINQQLDGIPAEDWAMAEILRQGDRLGQGRIDLGVKNAWVVGESGN